MLKAAFQMDAGVVVGKDLTAKFIEEGTRRGHSLFFYEPSALSLSEGRLVADACSVSVKEDSLQLYDKVRLHLEELDMIFVRQNPPFDMRYITTTYMLEMLKNVLFINSPKAVRDFPEKLSPLMFSEFIPPTLITENREEMYAFYREYRDIVVKPLYSYGGDGVIRLRGDIDVGSILDIMSARYGAPVVVQRFVPGVDDDKRVILLCGEPIGAIRRRVSTRSEFRTNLSVGAVPEAVVLSDRDLAICHAVGSAISGAGIVLAGIDILGGHLLEINVTSPCGILEINQVYGTALEKDCWDKFESMLP
ncbi:glutathione synthase [Candidatus Anaplasma sp. TIGMIC]|uniref:glutathione synthase n=1 Tax=Candidatus Anaplasma sp. TIGMIC TaxID=3020713 RepID=UPI0023313622|nr:glutathione synthase [Candidatus Anaplasma sp. TIGMIC]MDB1135546.1 glutathione synthase [Candidatus Anaplasma sp. TIGMIC]